MSPGVDAAWSIAVTVTALAFNVGEDVLRAESRGRGPRPPREAWEAKKMAVHLAVVLADCGYADLARHLGLHRDTVASHCNAMRETFGLDPRLEALGQALEDEARLRLRLGAFEALTASRARAAALEARFADEIRRYASSDSHPTNSEPFIRHVTNYHENVMSYPGERRA